MRPVLLLTGLAIALGGCASDPKRGYAFSSTHSTAVRSVAVPIFDNQSYQKGMEVELTDAIIKEIQRTTPWVVVQGNAGGGAQTTLTGSITEASLRSLTTNSQTGMVQEMGLELSVDFDWRDARTGQYLVSRRNFRVMETFVPARPANERLELGGHAAVQEMARDIVAELRSSW